LEQASQVRDPSMVMQGIGVGTLIVVSVAGLAAGAALGAPFMAFSPDGNHLLTATSSGVFIYDTVNWKKERLDSSK